GLGRSPGRRLAGRTGGAVGGFAHGSVLEQSGGRCGALFRAGRSWHMTPVRMNATSGISRAAVFGAVAVAALTLGGCLSFNPATDPASPAAAEVDAVVAAHRQYPRWADFPAGPRPPPPPAAIAREVA